MRGVSTWAVAVRAPSAEQRASGRRMAGDEPARGEIEVMSFPLVSVLKRHRWLRWPIIRGVVALGESLRLGFRALSISVNTQLPDGEEDDLGGTWAGTVVLALAMAIGLFFLLPVGITSLLRRPAAQRRRLRHRREAHPRLDLPRLPVGGLADEGPAARLRVPRRRAQDDLLLRGRRGADARERAALQPPAPALRHELPAHRDDRRRRGLRPARHAGVVLAADLPRRRDPAHRRPRVRGHQVVRAQPHQALGADPHAARP